MSDTPLKDVTIEILKQLQAAAPQATEEVIRFIWAQAITELVMSPILAVLGFLAFQYARKNPEDRYGMVSISAIFAGMACVGLWIFSLALLADGLPTAIAPAGAAIMKLITAVKP